MTQYSNFEQYLTEASKNTEDIKDGLVGYLNEVIEAGNGSPITIRVKKNIIRNVVAVRPYNKSSQGGIQPYVDLELIQSNGNRTLVGIRQWTGKGFDRRSAPAVFKGMETLEKVFPDIRRHFLASMLVHYTESENITHGQPVRQAYGFLDNEMKKIVLMGAPNLGGRADYLLLVDRASFRWKTKRIPEIKIVPSRTSVGVEVIIKSSHLMSQDEVLMKNEIALTVPKSDKRTLYLFNDKLDDYNNPVVLGPKFGSSSDKTYGGKVVVKMNPKVGRKSSFEIDPANENAFKLELKNPVDYIHNYEKSRQQKQDAETEVPVRPSYSGRNNRRFGSVPDNATADDFDNDYDFSQALITQIKAKYIKGYKKVYREDPDEKFRDLDEALDKFLSTKDSDELQVLRNMRDHMLVREIQPNVERVAVRL